MDERRKKALDFASDLAKQLITLSTGILAITITFSKDIVKSPSTPRAATITMLLAWGIYLFSIIFGIWTLMALTGELEPRTDPNGTAHEPTTKGSNVFWPTVLQIGSFLVATFMVILFGILSVVCRT
jgi:hypothetical protein